jgi:predicted adenylyl cyclase CyaB
MLQLFQTLSSSTPWFVPFFSQKAMASNIEIKARANDFNRLHQVAQQLSDQEGRLLLQEDIFFAVDEGRLKLRLLDPPRGELILYQRADQAGPRPSNYMIAPTTDPEALKTILLQTLPVIGRVRKRRTLYLVGQTRIHLDDVEDLGQFVELEYVLRPGEDPAEGQRVVEQLMSQLGIQAQDLTPQAYIDLLQAQEAERHLRSRKPWAHYYGRQGEDYDEAMRFAVGDEVLRQMRAAVEQEEKLGKVLELGCGTGFFTRFVAERATALTATDLSWPLLTVAQRRMRRLEQVTFLQMDCEQLDFPRESFDTVFMSNLITVVDAKKTLAECRRVLKPGGLLLIANLVTQRMEWRDRVAVILRTALRFGIPPLGRKDYSAEKLAALVALAGFKVLQARLPGQNIKFVYLRARKP